LGAALESRADSVPLLSLRERAGHVAERMTTRRSATTADRGLSTGLRALDAMTPGGLLPGQLIVLAGRPGLGKTSLLLQIALAAAASGKGCALLFSLEMEADELVERALCARALVDSGRAADGALSEEDARSILEAVPQLERLPVLFDPRSRLRMSDVRARVLSVRARQPVAFVGLDYLQLLEEDGDAESREEAISRATRECKLLAKEAGVPFALLSQFNRANEKDKRPPRISDLRGSGAIEQDADKVWMIHTEAEDAAPEPEVDIIVGKQRKGPKGPARVCFVRALTVFRDLAASAADEWTADEGTVV
jgi:replicative DNA helicase